MKVIYGINQIRQYRHPVVALGVFDGVHRGHRKIIAGAVRKAAAVKGTSVVVTFWPHPGEEDDLYSLQHRLRLLDELDVAVCIVIRFTRAFSALSAQDFVQRVLRRKIGAQWVYVGENFRFGRHARGTVATLHALSAECGFTVRVSTVMKTGGAPVSSTRIRAHIKNGRLKRAEALLGRPVSILGTVIHGAARGKTWGVPTANICPHHEVIPPSGVYWVRVYLGRSRLKGICYIGPVPRFIQKKRARTSLPNVEVHIFRFNKDIYGCNIEIQFLKKLRDRIEFLDPADLIKQIKKDVAKAR